MLNKIIYLYFIEFWLIFSKVILLNSKVDSNPLIYNKFSFFLYNKFKIIKLWKDKIEFKVSSIILRIQGILLASNFIN